MVITNTQHTATYTVNHDGEIYIRQASVYSELGSSDLITWYCMDEEYSAITVDDNISDKLEKIFKGLIE